MKSKKLLLTLLLVQLVLCLALSAFATESELAFDITFDTVEPTGSIVNKGEEFTVILSVTQNPCFANLSGTFTFDPEYVTYVSNSLENSVFTKDPAKCMVRVTESGLAAGQLPVVMYDFADAPLVMNGELCYDQTGILIEFTFVAKETIPAEAVIEFGFNVLPKNYAYVENYDPETGKGTGSVAMSTPLNASGTVTGIGEGHEHSWVPANCLEGSYCDVCLTPGEEALGHALSEEYIVEDGMHWQVCTRCGETTTPEAHKGGVASCTELAECEVCGESYGEMIPHETTDLKFDAEVHWYKCANCDFVSEKEAHYGGTATCVNKAVCTFCEQAYGDLAEHVLGEMQIENVVESSCTEAGKHDEVKYCTVEDCTYEVRTTVEDELKPHNYAAATCTEPEKCVDCGGTGAPAKGHTPGEKVTENTKAPNCTEDGSHDEVIYCTVEDCKAEIDRKTVTDAKLGHDWADATCTAPKTCKREGCNVTEGEKEPHSFGEWETTKAPTTKEEGEETRKCNNCGETETRPMEKLPTNYTWLIVAVILVLAAAGIVVVVVLKKKRQ